MENTTIICEFALPNQGTTTPLLKSVVKRIYSDEHLLTWSPSNRRSKLLSKSTALTRWSLSNPGARLGYTIYGMENVGLPTYSVSSYKLYKKWYTA